MEALPIDLTTESLVFAVKGHSLDEISYAARLASLAGFKALEWPVPAPAMVLRGATIIDPFEFEAYGVIEGQLISSDAITNTDADTMPTVVTYDEFVHAMRSMIQG